MPAIRYPPFQNQRPIHSRTQQPQHRRFAPPAPPNSNPYPRDSTQERQGVSHSHLPPRRGLCSSHTDLGLVPRTPTQTMLSLAHFELAWWLPIQHERPRSSPPDPWNARACESHPSYQTHRLVAAHLFPRQIATLACALLQAQAVHSHVGAPEAPIPRPTPRLIRYATKSQSRCPIQRNSLLQAASPPSSSRPHAPMLLQVGIPLSPLRPWVCHTPQTADCA